MKKEFIITRQGKEAVLYAGLLDLAHEQGLNRISTHLVQAPTEVNGQTAIVAAEVETAKGIFSGIGDACPTNVGRMIAPHIIRMAETRAKARALRDAVNIGMVSVEELGDDAPEQPASKPAAKTPIQFPSSSATPNGDVVGRIQKACAILGETFDAAGVNAMSPPQQRQLLADLTAQYQAQKGGRA